MVRHVAGADIDAVQSAFRVLMTMLGVLIFVTLKDEDVE